MRELRRKPSQRKLQPCGTPAAHHRHLRNGEKSDFACRIAENEYRRNLKESNAKLAKAA